MCRNSLTVFVLSMALTGVAIGSDVPPKAGEPNLITFSGIDYAEQKGTIFIDVHPEEKTDANSLDRRIIHPGLVSVPGHRARPPTTRMALES